MSAFLVQDMPGAREDYIVYMTNLGVWYLREILMSEMSKVISRRL